MTYEDVMTALESFGTAQNRKVYTRHGVKGAQFGVSYANLKLLNKKLKTSHTLALDLWQTANHDARVLATQIADPEQVTQATLDNFAADLDNYVLADALSVLVAKSLHAKRKVETWTSSDHDYTAQVGWNVLSSLALSANDLPDGFFTPYLDRVETSVHTQKNRTQHAMNQALIAVGVRNPELEKRALEVANYIGPVQVDHGETGCKTPEPAAYIAKTLARKGHVLATK